MSSEAPRLDRLPVEVLHRIASYGPCESALALLNVNRAIRQACNDRLVFKSIINNGNGPSREMPVWHCTFLTWQSPTSSWARYALADSRLAHMPISSTGHNHPQVDDYRQEVHWIDALFLKYGAPQLMASHHPLIDCANAVAIQACLKELEDNKVRSHVAQALSFCLATRVMSREFHETHQYLAPSGKIREELKRVLRNALYDSTEASMLSAQRLELLALKHSLANRAVSIFSFDLRCAILGSRVRNPSHLQQHPSSGVMLLPPSTLDIPFLSFMNVPLPFSPNAVKNFGASHLSTMTSPPFLEDGEWAGYYCYSTARRDDINFDTPMTGVRFVTSRRGDHPTLLNLSADGIDGVGSFYLQGNIDSETGRVLMRKRYLGRGWTWDWFAVMTPFGIVGSWGSSQHGGWFWLWKTQWLDGDRVSV